MADEGHKLRARVLTPEGPVFEGELHRISTRTVVGEIGILANHQPILARLVPSELRLVRSDSEGDVERYAAAEGWIEVFANEAKVLVGEAVAPAELDVSSLRDRLADAERRLDEADEGSAAQEEAERDKLRAEVFLEVAGAGD